MAIVLRGANSVSSTPINMQQMEDFVVNYWGNANLEKMFPLALWKAKRLFAAASNDEIALKISDIENPDEVDGKWLVFDIGSEDAVRDPNQLGEYYFVFEEETFNEIYRNPLIAFPHRHIIWGRLGKDNNGNYFAFFCAAKCDIVGGTGGEGGSTGFKIPPGQ
ncbi:MAG: hypothetical protein ACK4TA_08465 [Saprospiraceae bacterium]